MKSALGSQGADTGDRETELSYYYMRREEQK